MNLLKLPDDIVSQAKSYRPISINHVSSIRYSPIRDATEKHIVHYSIYFYIAGDRHDWISWDFENKDLSLKVYNAILNKYGYDYLSIKD